MTDTMAIIRWTAIYITLFCLAALAVGSAAIPGLIIIVLAALALIIATSRARRVFRRRTWIGDDKTNRELAQIDDELCEREAAEARRRADDDL